jgi:ornithine carbamoyltransferase
MSEVSSLKGRDFLTLGELSAEEFSELLKTGLELKNGWKQGKRPKPLADMTLAMIFEKQSLRTHSTFDIAMMQLGGHSILLSQNFIGVGVRETTQDVARNLERWVDAIMARTYRHETLEELARHANVPVINGLSDLVHPCQLLADYLTLLEEFGQLEGVVIAYVGDGNNICNSHLLAAMHSKTRLIVACPEGYDPEPDLLDKALSSGAAIETVRNPRDAALGADVLYTDVWISMGQEQDAALRRKAFEGYTITPEWFKDLSPRGIFMHDLPAHYGEECVAEAVYHPRSRVFDQAENRLHAHKAILTQLLGSGVPA